MLDRGNYTDVTVRKTPASKQEWKGRGLGEITDADIPIVQLTISGDE
ncbi:hypothetical protein MM300_21480 [Evansella sp. LMS18]|nr:hypothetical protein [Evansella sp. LMS18]UTR10407.1 hypothetical protein MM300_21480 [Evansella sp. LMS18]